MKCPFRTTDDGGGMDGAPKAGGSGGEGSAEKSNSLFLNENKEEGEGILVAPKTPVLTKKSGNGIGKARFRSFGPLGSFLLTIGIVICQGEVLMEGERGNEGIFNDQHLWKELEQNNGGASGQEGFLIDGPAYSSSSSRPFDQGRSYAALKGYENISEAGRNKNDKNFPRSHLRGKEGGGIKEINEEETILLKNKVIDSANSYTRGGPRRLENRSLETQTEDLKVIGIDHGNGIKLGICEGDCDDDEECATGLNCFQRAKGDPGPPGCKGTPQTNLDYCYAPSKVLTDIGLDRDKGTIGSFSQKFQGTVNSETGAITQVGSSTMTSSTFSRTTSSDIWGTNDNFSFTTQIETSSTDLDTAEDLPGIVSIMNRDSPECFEVVLKTNGFSDGAYSWSKFGLMIRETLEPGSKHFSVFVTGDQSVYAYFRKNTSSTSAKSMPSDASRPSLQDSGYLKLVKAGNVFTAFLKNTESSEFKVITTQTIDMTGDLHVGIALSVHTASDNQSETVSFSDFSLKKATPLTPVSIGDQDANGTFGENKFKAAVDPVKGTITQHGSTEMSSSNVGGDIWGTNDKFSFAHHTTVPESSRSFEVVLKTNGFSDGAYSWSKFGLMIRETLEPGSKHFSVFVTGDQSVYAYFRKNTSSTSAKSMPSDASRPSLQDSGYLKLVKAGNVFTAFLKNTESSEFKVITTQTIDMTGDLHVGIALSVHTASDNQSETVSFSDFSLNPYYPLYSKEYGKCVEVASDNKEVLEKACERNESMQQWVYDPVNLTLRVAGLSNKCLDWSKNSNKAIVWKCHGGNNQKWIWDHELGFLKSYDDKAKCAYISNRSNGWSENVRRLEVATCNRAMNNFGLSLDKWYVPIYLHGSNEKKCLQATSNNLSEGVCSGADSQLWMYDSLYKTIVNKVNPKKCLDWYRSSGHGKLHTCHGGYNQKWIVDELSRIVSFEDRNMCLSSNGVVQRCDKLVPNDKTNLFEKHVQFTIGSSMASCPYTRVGSSSGDIVAEMSSEYSPSGKKWYPDECGRECANHLDCEFWTLEMKGDKKCHLKKNRGTLTRADDYVEGVKSMNCLSYQSDSALQVNIAAPLSIQSARDSKLCLAAKKLVELSEIHLATCDSTSPLQQFEYFSSMGLVVMNTTMAKSKDKETLCLALQLDNDDDVINGNMMNENKFILKNCAINEKRQRWYYYNHILHLNHNREFAIEKTSSNDVVLRKKHGETNQRWNIDGGIAYFKDAIILQSSRVTGQQKCLHVDRAIDNHGVTVLPCNGSENQRWIVDESDKFNKFKIRSFLNDVLCLTSDFIFNGWSSRLRVKTCVEYKPRHIQTFEGMYQDWIWKDGSIRLSHSQNYIIEYKEPGPVITSFSHEDNRSRPLNQRWIVMGKREQKYHEATKSVRIRNDATVPIECALKQLSTLYWGVIYPGEEFYRKTGAVHFTVECRDVSMFGGVGQKSFTSAVQSVADITTAVAISVITAGAAAKFALSGYAALALDTALNLAYVTATTNGNMNALVETFLLNIAFAAVPVKMSQLRAFADAKYLKKTHDILSEIAIDTSRAWKTKDLAIALGQETVVGHVLPTVTDESIAYYSKKSSNSIVSKPGVYANGKLFNVRGGAKYRLDSSAQQLILQPDALYLDSGYGKKYAFELCNNDDECISNNCGRARDDSISGYFCCPDGMENGSFCNGVVGNGNKCTAQEDCSPGFHCYCGSDVEKNCNRTCRRNVEIGGKCEKSDHCGHDAYCKNNKCTSLRKDSENCPDNNDESCLSGKCAWRGEDWDTNKDDRVCCPSRYHVTVNFQEYCARIKENGMRCFKNDHCKSGYCDGSNGMGASGRCIGPFDDGEECPGSEDDMCKSKACGYPYAGANYHVCCTNDVVEHGGIDYCNLMEDGKLCWLDKMCKSGYCAGNNGGLTKGMCVNKGAAETFEPCYNGFDNACKGAECAKFLFDPSNDSYHEYMCCPGGTSIPGGWASEICTNMKVPGDTCPSTDDDECQGDKGCGRTSREDSTYICCEHGTGTYKGVDYCRNVLNIGDKCHFDDQCRSGECETFTDGTSTCVGSKDWDCDCDYRSFVFSGGCYISKAAPKGYACLCRYMSSWTCQGYTTTCRWPYADSCKYQGTDKKHCNQGYANGAKPDCGGY